MKWAGSSGGRLRSAFRSRAASTTMLSVATAAVVVMAVTATGFPVNHVAANDGGVWITNNNPGNGFRGSFGEFNAPIKQLGYSFGDPGASPSPTYNLDVLQDGATVLAVDRGQGAVYPVNSQGGTPDSSAGVTFPSGSQVALGGGVAAILRVATTSEAAQLWTAVVGTGPTPAISSLNGTTAKATLKLQGGAAVAVDQAGDVFVASRTELVTLPFTGGALKPAVTIKFVHPLSSVALTAVGTTPVILDTAERVVHFPTSGQATTVPDTDASGQLPALQQVGPADGSVIVATQTGLISFPLSGQAPSTLATVPAGQPANPVRLDGCAYGVWASSPAQAAQVCESGGRTVGPLPGMTGATATLQQPVLRVNHDQIVLNDMANGNTWIVAGRPSQVLTNPDWLRVLIGTRDPGKGDKPVALPNQTETQPILSNPTLYARAGRDSVLHVLDHDSDPGGSILSIVNVTPGSGPGFSVRVTPDTQSVILSLQDGATQSVKFSYQVVDGFGLTASGPVTVTPTTDQKPPIPPAKAPLARPVVSGGTVNLQVLGDWRSPQNDPMSLADASVPPGSGQVLWTSDGLITLSAASVASDTATVITYHVTDGRSAPVAGQLPLETLGRGDITASAPTGVPDAVKVLVNQPTVFSPLSNDVFGADPNQRAAKLALSGPVGSTTGLAVATNLDTGQVTLTASRAGPYSIKYQASFGSGVSGPTQILVQAVDPAGTVQPPVTSPQSLLLHGQYPATVDVLAGDYDPAGGLLTVTGVTPPAGLQATIVQGAFLRIAAVTSDPPTVGLLTYQVTNGRTDSVIGQVTVLWQPAPTPEAPVVPDTYATVRAGDEVDVPVLASAADPDGESVHLMSGGAPVSVAVSQTNPAATFPTGLGSASISGTYLRYSAPNGTGVTAPESVTVSYVVESQNGDRTSGHTFVTIVPNDPASTTPPQPTEVDARVSAGATVTIPIPTSGVAPDGDSVTLVGITSAPHLGRLLSYKTNSIVYQAFPFAANTGAFAGGTDTFTYQVEGPSGLMAQAAVRVGVTPPAQTPPPLAVDHFVTTAPNDQVDVDLLAGDYVAHGDQVTVEDLSKTNTSVPAGATLVGTNRDTLQATAPSGASPVTVAYGITDGTTSPSVAHVLIRSEPGYVTPPVATDYFPAAPAPSAQSITVDVLTGDSDPAGNAGDLSVLGSPIAGVQVVGSNLVIPVGPNPRAVPYVIQSGATKATAVGVVHVLGLGMGPQLRADQMVHV
ncbi:MAG: hypothetical protein QOF30_3656, partial [Acidimicrobiaceae bacterium]|nr:hypothetical protein [Acidimicrobiaceae bacterium]